MEISKILSHHHYELYSQETKTYSSKKDSGIYSIFNWIIRKIALLEMNGFPVETLKIDYYNQEIYDLLFEKKECELNFSDISDEEKIFFEEKFDTTGWGLGDDVKLLNFKITNKIINKFFNPSKLVLECYDKIIKSNNIDLNNTIFVWARSTDKHTETRLPSVEVYLKIINSIDLYSKEIIVQTDDYRVLEGFKNSEIKFKTISEIPISGTLNGFHIEMSKINDDTFKSKYGITKNEYLLQMYCLSLIAKNSHKTILYPGNPTTFVPIIKGSLNDCFLFKDDNKLFQ
jgi:hypothetical protein